MNSPTRFLAGAVIALAGCLGLIGAYVDGQEALSPFDEWVYSDYLEKMTRLDLPQSGEVVDEYAMALSSCRGVFVWGPTGSPCGGPYRPAEYPQGGVNSASIHAPTYFAPTAGFAWAATELGLAQDLLTAGRLVGSLWLALGLMVTYMLARVLGAGRIPAIAMVIVLAILPITRWTNSYVTPDNLNYLVGGGVALLAVMWERGRLGLLWLAFGGFLAVAIKAHNVLVVLAAAIYLVIGAVMRRRGKLRVEPEEPEPIWRAGKAVVALGAASALPVLAWAVIQRAFALGEVPGQGLGSEVTWNLIAEDTTSFVLRLGLGATETGLPVPTYAVPLLVLLIAGGFGALFYSPLAAEETRLMTAVTILLFLGGPLLILASWLFYGLAFPSPTRYGASLLPAWVAVTATAFTDEIRSRLLLGGVLALAVFVAYGALVS